MDKYLDNLITNYDYISVCLIIYFELALKYDNENPFCEHQNPVNCFYNGVFMTALYRLSAASPWLYKSPMLFTKSSNLKG